MVFRTVINPGPSAAPISYGSNILMLGSCFSDSVSRRLSDAFISTLANPLGTIYNPASIAQTMQRIADNRPVAEDELFCHEGLFHSFDCHSSLSKADGAEMATETNRIIAASHSFLQSATHLILTLGTAWIYRLAADGRIVANCHKQPASTFNRSMLSVGHAAEEIRRAIRAARSISPGIAVTLTVSPIRHLADGATGNSLSKATLLLACREVAESEQLTEYFPSYELLLDDLRDYRFYASDMCHPSETAVDYIFEKFCEAHLSDSTRQLMSRCLKLRKRLNHTHRTDNTDLIARFDEGTRCLAHEIASQSPVLGVRLHNILHF